MATLKQLLASIEAAPKGPQVAAIFDFDGTLITGYSAVVFIREQIRRGDLSPRDFVELIGAMASFGLGKMGFSAMMLITAQFMRGMSEQAYREMGEDLYLHKIASLIYPESRALVDAHLAKGHTVAVVSSATPYQVEPAARDLGIDHVLCTYLEVDNGEFTGGVVKPTCFGHGKVIAAQNLADEVGANLDESFFYSDSMDDIQLLEHVGHPVALNPSKKLQVHANKKNWPVASFESRGPMTIGQFIRSAAATVSLVPAFAAGLPIYALTGSRTDSNNFSLSLFADTASALIGLKLNIQGEEHLWSQRPAVFIFNHQSKADIIILASLIRRDMAAIGKKEIRKMPVIGQVMEFGGVVLIDRQNARSAIEAMKPLVTAMKEDGKSVILSPEGTRTVSPRLNPFKKGAFHLAMQAGVPIVPIVIRNAVDVAPKGGFVFHPATVDVTVLPPVQTSGWTRRSINQHVREIRNMFLETLGQEDESAEVKIRRRDPISKPPVEVLSTAKKAAAKKAVAKKAVAKKAVAKKAVAKKAVARLRVKKRGRPIAPKHRADAGSKS